MGFRAYSEIPFEVVTPILCGQLHSQQCECYAADVDGKFYSPRILSINSFWRMLGGSRGGEILPLPMPCFETAYLMPLNQQVPSIIIA